MPRARLAVLAVCLSVGAASCARQPPLNIVIVTLDTVRADRVSAYGFMDVGMPAFDRLAATGVVFDRAMTVAPLTLPAHTSLFTGLLPPAHGVRDNADPPLAEAYETLAERLLSRGYRTGAFIGSVVLARDRGLAQGFQTYVDVPPPPRRLRTAPQRQADAVIDDALRWLDAGAGEPFFLWTHLYDAHLPYEPPDPFRAHYSDPYIGELAFVDAQLGRLLAALDRRQLTDRTAVIVLADHGESLGDHGEIDHGVFVYDSVMRIPMVIRAPGVAARRDASLTRIVDVVATVMALVGAPLRGTHGVNLLRSTNGGGSDADRDAYMESLYPRRFGWSGLQALTDGRYKFIDAPRPELYDLIDDPFEERDIAATRPALASAMARRLGAMAAASATGARPPSHPPSTELVERLSALGYLAGNAGSEGRRSPRPDPKDCMASLAARRDAVGPWREAVGPAGLPCLSGDPPRTRR
jgi:arylsulfatase A-like enzyme